MGIKIEPNKRVFDLKMFFSEDSGKLMLSTSEPTIKGKKNILSVNGVDVDIEFNESGIASIQFDKSDSSVWYKVKLKNKGSLKDDQRLAFFY